MKKENDRKAFEKEFDKRLEAEESMRILEAGNACLEIEITNLCDLLRDWVTFGELVGMRTWGISPRDLISRTERSLGDLKHD